MVATEFTVEFSWQSAISYAFIEHDIHKILEKGLSYIPEDCEYAYVVRKVMEFYEAHPENWRDCFQYILRELWI